MKQGADWDPLKELATIQKKMNRLFETALVRTEFDDGAKAGVDAWTPQCDVFESDSALEIQLELPGLTQTQIDVRIDGDDLLVRGERTMERARAGERFHRVERSYGRFSRRIHLPSTVDREGVDASYRLGVLVVRLPKRQGGQPGPQKITIG